MESQTCDDTPSDNKGPTLRIAFFATAIVELDNFMPIYDALKRQRPDLTLDIIALHYGVGFLQSPFFAKHIASANQHTIFDYIASGVPRVLLRVLSRVLSLLHLRKARKKSSYPERLLSGFARAAVQYVVGSLESGSCNRALGKYDLWVMSPGIIGKIKRREIRYFQGLIDWKESFYEKVVLCPETFDQWNEVEEHAGASDLFNLTSVFAVLSRGDETKRAKFPGRTRIFNIGAPRYSEYWCRTLDQFYRVEPIKNQAKKFIEILYLPIKPSPPEPWMIEVITRMDREVFDLIDTYLDVRVTVSPHPRTFNVYADAGTRVRDTTRLIVREINKDTAEMASKADICVTGGTSFIPHLLWLGVPVVLRDEWAEKLGQTFVLADACLKWPQIAVLIESTRARNASVETNMRLRLRELFQCGLDSEGYQKYLGEQLDSILSCLKSENETKH